MLGQAITSSFGYWEEQGDMGNFKMPTTRPEIAKAIWKIGAEKKRLGHSLGARVKALSGSCDKATWARVAIGPAPKVSVAAKAEALWAKPALEQFKRKLATPELKQEIGRYREEGADSHIHCLDVHRNSCRPSDRGDRLRSPLPR